MSTNAPIWVRVSTDRQHEDNQIPDLERLCERRGWEIARRYEIADASAYKGYLRRGVALDRG
jgi:DNA invertase Pin-like site-specific DNA recombinase